MNAIDKSQIGETSATRSVYLTVREMILTGKLPAGEKLKIDQLRKMLDTGASPVREALSLLTSDMLVERIDQRGFRTAQASAANFEEILNLRCALESMAVRQSMAQADAFWEEQIVLAHHRMKRAEGGETERFEETHKAFHMTLLDRCGSPMLLKFCSQLYDLNIRYRYLAAGTQGYKRRDVSKEHTHILDAVLAGDVELTVERLMNHYQTTGEFLTNRLSEIEATDAHAAE